MGKTSANDSTRAAVKVSVSARSHTANRNIPSGLSTRATCAKAAGLSGKNITPNWHTTMSNEAVGKSRDCASATSHVGPLTRPAA